MQDYSLYLYSLREGTRGKSQSHFHKPASWLKAVRNIPSAKIPFAKIPFAKIPFDLHLHKGSMTGSSQIADPECISYEATEIFARQLTSEWTREKTPYRFDDALERARSASEEDTARIFLDAGFSAWLAYFLATNSSTRYYKGQQAEQQTLAAFERLSTENRKVVATKLFNTKAHDTVRPMIEQLSNRLKRRRELTVDLFMLSL